MPKSKPLFIALPDTTFAEIASTVAYRFAAVAQTEAGDWEQVSGRPYRTEAEAAQRIKVEEKAGRLPGTAAIVPIYTPAEKDAELARRAEALGVDAIVEEMPLELPTFTPAAEPVEVDEQPAGDAEESALFVGYGKKINHIGGLGSAASACPTMRGDTPGATAALRRSEPLPDLAAAVKLATADNAKLCHYCKKAAGWILGEEGFNAATTADAPAEVAEVAEVAEAATPVVVEVDGAGVELVEVELPAETEHTNAHVTVPTPRDSKNATEVVPAEAMHVRLPDGTFRVAELPGEALPAFAVAVLGEDGAWGVESWHTDRKTAELRLIGRELSGSEKIVLPVWTAAQREAASLGAIQAGEKVRGDIEEIRAKLATKRGTGEPAGAVVTATMLNDSRGIIEGLPAEASIKWVKGKYRATAVDGTEFAAHVKEKAVKGLAQLMGVRGRIVVAIDVL